MSERRLTDDEIANGIDWRTKHNDDTFTLAALTELRDLRRLVQDVSPLMLAVNAFGDDEADVDQLAAAAAESEPKDLKEDLAHWRWMTVVLLGVLGLEERNAVATRRGMQGDVLRKAVLKANTVVEVRSFHIELLMATQMGAAIYGADDPDERKDLETAERLFGLSWDKAQRIAKEQAKVNAAVAEIKKGGKVEAKKADKSIEKKLDKGLAAIAEKPIDCFFPEVASGEYPPDADPRHEVHDDF